MNAPLRQTLALKDPSLLRQQCYVDGEWRNADGGGSNPVTNPATGAVLWSYDDKASTVPSTTAAGRACA